MSEIRVGSQSEGEGLVATRGLTSWGVLLVDRVVWVKGGEGR